MKKNNKLISFSDLHTHQITYDKNIQSIFNLSLNNKDFFTLESNINYSCGIHPWDINNEIESIEKFDILQRVIKNRKISAIGECGLDKLTGNFKLQKFFFIKQALLAQNLNLPLIIHCVKSYNELIDIKKDIKPSNKWIIHGFNKKVQLAKQLIKEEFYLSFGVELLKNKDLSKTFKSLPLEKIFLESDESKIDIRELYLQCSLILKKDIDKLKKIFSLKKLFE